MQFSKTGKYFLRLALTIDKRGRLLYNGVRIFESVRKNDGFFEQGRTEERIRQANSDQQTQEAQEARQQAEKQRLELQKHAIRYLLAQLPAFVEEAQAIGLKPLTIRAAKKGLFKSKGIVNVYQVLEISSQPVTGIGHVLCIDAYHELSSYEIGNGPLMRPEFHLDMKTALKHAEEPDAGGPEGFLRKSTERFVAYGALPTKDEIERRIDKHLRDLLLRK